MVRLRNMKVIAINVNSILTIERRMNLIMFIENQNPDIILLSETNLNEKCTFEIQGYNIARNDRNRLGGGTAIILKRHFNFKHIAHINHQLSSIESTFIEIKLKKNNKLIVGSLYSGPNQHDRNFIYDINFIFNYLNFNSANNYYIIAGDLNAKHNSWNNTVEDSRGKKLRAWLNDNTHFYKIKLIPPNKPTYPRTKSTLDLALWDERIKTTNENYINTINYDSDHRALQFNIKSQNIKDLIINSTIKILELNE